MLPGFSSLITSFKVILPRPEFFCSFTNMFRKLQPFRFKRGLSTSYQHSFSFLSSTSTQFTQRRHLKVEATHSKIKNYATLKNIKPSKTLTWTIRVVSFFELFAVLTVGSGAFYCVYFAIDGAENSDKIKESIYKAFSNVRENVGSRFGDVGKNIRARIHKNKNKDQDEDLSAPSSSSGSKTVNKDTTSSSPTASS